MISVGYLGGTEGEAAVRETAHFATLTINVLTEGTVSPSCAVIIVGSGEPSALKTAQRLLAKQPQAQIIFLVPPERLSRFRESLPFIPRLAASWTADASSSPKSSRRQRRTSPRHVQSPRRFTNLMPSRSRDLTAKMISLP
jgi:hypothetical protein